jgi:FixJ family two-component response regulator
MKSERSDLEPVVFVIDDDELMRKALSNLCRSCHRDSGRSLLPDS